MRTQLSLPHSTPKNVDQLRTNVYKKATSDGGRFYKTLKATKSSILIQIEEGPQLRGPSYFGRIKIKTNHIITS